MPPKRCEYVSGSNALNTATDARGDGEMGHAATRRGRRSTARRRGGELSSASDSVRVADTDAAPAVDTVPERCSSNKTPPGGPHEPRVECGGGQPSKSSRRRNKDGAHGGGGQRSGGRREEHAAINAMPANTASCSSLSFAFPSVSTRALAQVLLMIRENAGDVTLAFINTMRRGADGDMLSSSEGEGGMRGGRYPLWAETVKAFYFCIMGTDDEGVLRERCRRGGGGPQCSAVNPCGKDPSEWTPPRNLPQVGMGADMTVVDESLSDEESDAKRAAILQEILGFISLNFGDGDGGKSNTRKTKRLAGRATRPALTRRDGTVVAEGATDHPMAPQAVAAAVVVPTFFHIDVAHPRANGNCALSEAVRAAETVLWRQPTPLAALSALGEVVRFLLSDVCGGDPNRTCRRQRNQYTASRGEGMMGSGRGVPLRTSSSSAAFSCRLLWDFIIDLPPLATTPFHIACMRSAAPTYYSTSSVVSADGSYSVYDGRRDALVEWFGGRHSDAHEPLQPSTTGDVNGATTDSATTPITTTTAAVAQRKGPDPSVHFSVLCQLGTSTAAPAAAVVMDAEGRRGEVGCGDARGERGRSASPPSSSLPLLSSMATTVLHYASSGAVVNALLSSVGDYQPCALRLGGAEERGAIAIYRVASARSSNGAGGGPSSDHHHHVPVYATPLQAEVLRVCHAVGISFAVAFGGFAAASSAAAALSLHVNNTNTINRSISVVRALVANGATVGLESGSFADAVRFNVAMTRSAAHGGWAAAVVANGFGGGGDSSDDHGGVAEEEEVVAAQHSTASEEGLAILLGEIGVMRSGDSCTRMITTLSSTGQTSQHHRHLDSVQRPTPMELEFEFLRDAAREFVALLCDHE